MTAEDVLRRILAAVPEPIHPLPDREHFFEAGKFVPPKLGVLAEEVGHLRRGPDGSLWRYEKGVYLPDGDDWLAEFARAQLGEEFRRNRLTEITAWCRANASAQLPVQPPLEPINLTNGLLFWKEDPPRLAPHSPEIASIIQLPVAWDPDARCPTIAAFLNRVLPTDEPERHFDLLMDWAGYCLIPSGRYKKALLLDGPGDTGKSTVLALFEHLLGHRSVSNATLQSIADDRFAAADLYGKLANISADLDAKAIRSTGVFKILTGGQDSLRVERKYRDAFSFKPFVKLMFSANEAPGTSDQSDAFYARWLILPMNRQIPRAEQRRDLIDRMTTDAELSGLLRLAVLHLKLLTRRQGFDEPKGMQHAAAEYRRRTDTVVGFVDELCVFDPQVRQATTPLYVEYCDWCKTSNRPALGKDRFREHISDVYPDVEHHKKYRGVPTWFGIRLRRPEDDEPM
jgi:putative DNA primase/helicase